MTLIEGVLKVLEANLTGNEVAHHVRFSVIDKSGADALPPCLGIGEDTFRTM